MITSPETEPRDAPGVTPEWKERCERRMDRLDSLPRDIRALVHEFGSTIVIDFLNCGVRNPRHIRHLVRTVLDGASQYGNNNGGGLLTWRCSELGALIGSLDNRDGLRDQCCAAFDRAAGQRR